MQQFSSLLSWRLLTAQHVSGVFPPIIRSSMAAVAASGFTFVSWWQSCCVRGRAGYHQPDATVFQFIILTFIYSSTRFGRFPAHHQELNGCSCILWFYLLIVVTVVLCLWSGWKTPETCWAVNKRQDNKLENCCIWLVIYLNSKFFVYCCYDYKIKDNRLGRQYIVENKEAI